MQPVEAVLERRTIAVILLTCGTVQITRDASGIARRDQVALGKKQK